MPRGRALANRRERSGARSHPWYVRSVDSTLVAELIPVVAILTTFGMPVAIVYVVKYFKYRHRELEAELEARRMLSERDKAQLEVRIERLESVLLAGARAPLPQQQLAPPVAQQQPVPELYEPPPLPEGAWLPGTPGKREPTR